MLIIANSWIVINRNCGFLRQTAVDNLDVSASFDKNPQDRAQGPELDPSILVTPLTEE